MDAKIKAKKIIRKLKELFPEVKIALNFSHPWELLVATILSAQTTDKKVNEVTEKLFKKYKTIESYANAPLSQLQKDISSINYYKNKARFIKESAKMILEEFGGKVPDNMEDLLKLKGVARKTANIVLYSGFGKTEGIAVDTHVKRLTRLWGLTKNTNPDKIEQDLMKIIPKKEWGDFSLRVIEYGRKYCPAKPHDHDKCPIK
ncbi:Endonuclease III [bacterium HR34]|nr:Endonuclease III [bacterium HR34]